MVNSLRSRLRIRRRRSGETWGQYYQAHELPFGILIFVAGFLWDVVMQSDIDDPAAIIQQAAYLLLIGWGLFYEFRESFADWKPRPFFQRIWRYREIVLHFFLGSLLSLYTLFFFKSASLSSSFIFLAVVVGLLVANEFPQLQSKGPMVRLALWTLCLSAFFSAFVPLLFGSVGPLPFFVALLATSLCIYYFYRWSLRRLGVEQRKRANRAFYPAHLTLLFYLVAYLLKLTPPVPLSVNTIGIYHKVEKQGDQYVLTEERPWWRFWHRGDQLFHAKPGDRVYVYTTIYSPTRFSDEVRIRWLFKDPRQGWLTSDLIPMKIVGGRGEGFRGFAYKANYQPGQWRVQIETTDEREIGRIGLEIRPAGT